MRATHGSGAPRLGVRRALARGLQAALLLAYPLIVYLASSRLDARRLGALLLGLLALSLLLRLPGAGPELRRLARPQLGLALLIGLAVASGSQTLLLLLPVAVSLALLGVFAASLRRGPPLVERIARLVEDDLPDFTLPYCRGVTVVWCVFLAGNALVAGGLALAAPLSWWALYTGVVFYLLLGALLAGEFVVRKLWFRYYQDGLADRLFARLFPAERSESGRRSLAYQEARRRRAEASRRCA